MVLDRAGWDAFVCDEAGGDLIEYSLMAALVALVCASAVGTFGKNHLLKEFTTIGNDFKKDVK
jgi:Flp pilus assembly pilin Flp